MKYVTITVAVRFCKLISLKLAVNSVNPKKCCLDVIRDDMHEQDAKDLVKWRRMSRKAYPSLNTKAAGAAGIKRCDDDECQSLALVRIPAHFTSLMFSW